MRNERRVDLLGELRYLVATPAGAAAFRNVAGFDIELGMPARR
jgi:hypothetical protein